MTIVVKGLKEVQQQLINLGSVTGTKAMRGAMYAATTPLLRKARDSSPHRSGALRKALRKVFLVGRFGFLGGGGSTFRISVGPKVRDRTAVALYNLIYKPKHPRRGIYHGHFLEFGTSRGVRRTDFMRIALASTAQRCVDLLAKETQKRIEKALRTKSAVND